jgi:hypothetical protein
MQLTYRADQLAVVSERIRVPDKRKLLRFRFFVATGRLLVETAMTEPRVPDAEEKAAFANVIGNAIKSARQDGHRLAGEPILGPMPEPELLGRVKLAAEALQ